MIEAEKLTKYYGDRAVVRDLSFEVKKGEIVGLLGPNGAGKTTTMRMLTGYLPIDGGRAVVAGYDVVDKPVEVRKRLGYLPETVPLYTEMPVRAYLDFTAKIRGVPSKGRNRRIEEVMELCRIADVSEKVIGKLSRGYKQRVGLAQAIIHNPQVIILDEPTVGLDPRQIIEIRKVIRDLAGNHSMILSTHILPEVSALCDRVVIVNRGRVLVEDTLANLERQGANSERLRLEVRGPQQEIQDFLTRWPDVLQVEIPTSAAMASVDSQGNVAPAVDPDEEAVEAALGVDNENNARFNLKVTPNTDIRESLSSAIIQQGWGLREIGLIVPSLEEIFIRLITEDLARLEEEENESTEDLEDREDDELTAPVRVHPVSDDDEMDEPDGEIAAVVNSEAELNSHEVVRREGSNPVNARQRVYPVAKTPDQAKRKAAPSFLTASPKDRSSSKQRAVEETQTEILPASETDQNSTDTESERE